MSRAGASPPRSLEGPWAERTGTARSPRLPLEAAVLTALRPNGERAREALVLDTVLRPCLPPGVVAVYWADGHRTPPDGLVQAARRARAGPRVAWGDGRVHRAPGRPGDERGQGEEP
ncbi:hypothetical protein CSW39_08030, partial [Thermus scotoductus]|uniref:hypothetical protein n=1 Tax=Thermus scotoductus TaxID=37636 RepID=UPI0010041552